MDWLANILTSANAIPVLIFALIVIGIGYILIKKGILSFTGKGLSIGKESQEKERTILRDQFEYIKTVCDGEASKLVNAHTHLSIDKTKYIVAKVADVFELAVVLNAMTTEDAYIKLKSTMVLNTILKRTTDPLFRTEEFKDYIDKFTKDMIKALIDIRAARG